MYITGEDSSLLCLLAQIREELASAELYTILDRLSDQSLPVAFEILSDIPLSSEAEVYISWADSL